MDAGVVTMLVEFRRLSDTPPPERELLEVADDGTATAWRSNGAAIGRFAGPVADASDLRTFVAAAREADPPEPGEVPPGASVETIETGGATGRVVSRRQVAGPWAPLVEACRAILGEIVESPVAAIGLVLAADGGMRLEHRGTEPLAVELASLAGGLKLWRDGVQVGGGPARGPDADRVEAGPGWALELALSDLDTTGGGILVGEVTFVADDGGVYVPVRLSASLTI
jgi:hypothetical protein